MDTTVGAMSMQWGSRRKWGDVHAAKVGVEQHAVVGEGERDEGCPGLGGFFLYSGLQVMVGQEMACHSLVYLGTACGGKANGVVLSQGVGEKIMLRLA